MERQLLWVLGMVYSLHGAAAIYQWKDGAGVVQFSDRRPPDQAQVIERPDLESGTDAPVVVAPALKSRATRAATVPAPRQSTRTSASATDKAREKHAQHCASQQRRIEKIRSQLRAGYSAQRGIKLNERLRAARDAFYSECR